MLGKGISGDAIDKLNPLFSLSGTASEKLKALKQMLLKVQALLSSKFKHKEILVLDETIDYRLIARENELVQVVINIISNALEELDKVQDKQRIIKPTMTTNTTFI